MVLEEKRLADFAAVLLSTLLFSLFHSFQISSHQQLEVAVQALNAFVVEIAAANATVFFGTLWVGVFLHLLMNLQFHAAGQNGIVNSNIVHNLASWHIPGPLLWELFAIAMLVMLAWINVDHSIKVGDATRDLS